MTDILEKVEAIYKAMNQNGRYNMSAAHFLERQFIAARCEYERKQRELWQVQYALESAARGLVHWSFTDQFQKDDAGEIIGGYRAHPNYADIWSNS